MTRYQAPSPQPEPPGWIDRQFIEMSWLLLIGFTLFFFLIMWIFSALGLLLGKHPVARRKAKILFTICTVYAVFVGIMIYSLSHNP